MRRRIRRLLLLVGLAVLRAVPRELQSFRRRSVARLPKRLHRLDGGDRVKKRLRSEDLVLNELEKHNAALSKMQKADVILFLAPMTFGVDETIRDYIEDIKAKDASNKHLCAVLRSPGGYIEVVERIYNVFRKHYDLVTFIVPDYAYSAGTVLVLSGDEIYMDYYSVLGPIDPQFPMEDGQFSSGIGYLSKYNELVDAINADKTGDDTRAQLTYLIKKFDPAKLFQIEQARNYSQTLLKAWLPKHKFKHWDKTDSGKAVDEKMKQARANEIADILGQPKKWHSHGRGIGLKELQSEEIKLKIQDFSADKALNVEVRGYHDLFCDFCNKKGIQSAIHGVHGLRRFT
jgi:hypothetical protein